MALDHGSYYSNMLNNEECITKFTTNPERKEIDYGLHCMERQF